METFLKNKKSELLGKNQTKFGKSNGLNNVDLEIDRMNEKMLVIEKFTPQPNRFDISSHNKGIKALRNEVNNIINQIIIIKN